jgi:hypothetical protein
VWAAAAGDSAAAILSLAGTADNTIYYVYALADPSPDRSQSLTNITGKTATDPGWDATGKKKYDVSQRGQFSGGVFLGRSGPLYVQHPPEFIVAGWDYDSDGDDAFSATGVVQIRSDYIGNSFGGGTQKDNVNATIDSGDFFGLSTAGTALASFNSGYVPAPQQTISFIYAADDIDDPSDFDMNIILSTTSGLTVANLSGSGIDSFDVASAIRIAGTDTLKTGSMQFLFDPIIRDATTNLITSFIPEATYNVYFVATDGTHRTVYQVVDDPYQSSPTAATLRIKHSPNIQQVDAFSLNDFDGDGNLDVVTGIENSTMLTDADGKNLPNGPSTRFVNIFWGSAGLEADLDVDDNATIDLYYSTMSQFKHVGGSAGYTSGNSDGTDLLGRITQGNNDTHLFAQGIREDPDGRFSDSFAWDIWNYVSPEGTIPRTGVNYYIYGLLKGGSTTRLESFTTSGSIVFQHPPHLRVIEPASDITVTVDEPVSIQWEAFDVDGHPASGLSAVPVGTSGRQSPNSRNDSNNIRIFLTTSDFGDVTTYASITNAASTGLTPFWLANSADGGLFSEIELNEGVDSSFVIQGRNMTRNIGNVAAFEPLDLNTNGGLGRTYSVYVAIDRGNGNTASSQAVRFNGRSPLVRAPGRITFTGNVPTLPTTSARLTLPRRIVAVSGQTVQIPIIPDEGDVNGTTGIDVVDIFLTVDPALFEAVDTDGGASGIQPFVLGTNAQISGSNVSQRAYIDGSGMLRLDFIYNTGGGSGALTFFDNQQILATANLRARPLSGSSTVGATITVDNSGTRVSKMISGSSTLGLAIPAPIDVNIVRRAKVVGTVPLQGRTSSADTIGIILREVGDLINAQDSLFALNDAIASLPGVQVITTGVSGAFSLDNVPSGRWVLTARANRHLMGHDTLIVDGGTDIAGFQPTLDGAGVDRTFLLAGDAAGYSDSTGANIPDNTIGSQDISAVNDALFSQPGEANWNTYADINRDLIVNGTDKDYTTVNTTDNTGSGNIVPVFPTFKQAVVEGENAKAVLVLKDLPTSEVSPGETFDVTVAVEGAVAVRTYEFHLSYDPEMIEVTDLVSQGTLFQNYRFDLGGKDVEGDLGLVNSILGQTPLGASGEGTLATIRFRAISRSVETALALTDALLINVDHEPVTPQLADGAMVVLSSDPIVYHDAAGERVLGLILADLDAVVDFNDFVAFAGSFGTAMGDAQFDLRADLNCDDSVNFADFLIFTENFGRTAIDAPAALRAGKPASLSAGVNAAASVRLAVAGEARMGELLTLTANVDDAQALQGWGFSVEYDATQYEFVEARAPEGNLLESAGGEAPLFLQSTDESGVISLASAVSNGPVANGEGVVAELVFRPIGDIENSLFDIANGVVFDPNQLQNRVGTPGSLEVRAIPTSFALNQNFPNPFNPETTISYDLADGGRVEMGIYNVMGQMVNQLVSEEQAAGRYRVVWDGSDAIGRSVASGVYFYRLNTTQYNAVRKLMLLK